jgi:HEPN domain-containing protein
MMRTDLDYLPIPIQAELARASEILFGEFAEALRGKQAPHRKAGRILKIILFGTFAREDWRAHDAGEDTAGFDLLVIVNHDDLADSGIWRFATDRLHRAWTAGRLLRPVRLTVHSLAEVNAALADGVPWFVRIADSGIAIHQISRRPLATPRRLPPVEHHARAQAEFERWFPNADTFIMGAAFYRRRGSYPMAAVLLHQACEHLYQCVLWTLTLRGRRTHALDELRALAEQQDACLADAWPRATRFERRAFSRVRRAYVEARYTNHYRIELEELAWAKERTRHLRRLVAAVCREHLDTLAGRATDAERPYDRGAENAAAQPAEASL